MTAPAAGTAAGRARVLAAHGEYLVTTAGRAPSVHNSQPWRFRIGPEAVELWCDPRRRTGSDASGREMLISCGAALFGLRLAVRSLGYQPRVALLPDPAQLRLMARVTLGATAEPNDRERQMLAAIPHRHTHRGPFAAGPLPPGLLAGLQNDTRAEGAELAIVPDGLPYGRLVRLVTAAARRGDMDPSARATIRRWTRAAKSAARDGVPASALVAAGPAKPFTRQPGRLLQRDFDLGRDIGLLPVGSVPPSATAILVTKGDRRADWLHAGQALHHLLLHAASSWVFASLYTQPIEDAGTRLLIREQLNLPGKPQVILQLGRSLSAAATPRRPVGELILQPDQPPRPDRSDP